jgi:hypothetical protein
LYAYHFFYQHIVNGLINELSIHYFTRVSDSSGILLWSVSGAKDRAESPTCHGEVTKPTGHVQKIEPQKSPKFP